MAAAAASRAPGRGPGASSRQDPRGARRLLPPGRRLPPRPRAPRRPGPPRPLCGGVASSSACVRPRAQRVHGRRRRARGGGVRASASGLPFSPSSPSPSISLSCGCQIRLRGAVTRRPELGPVAGPRGARRGARSLGPALRGAGGAWPRPAAGRCSPDGRTGTIFFDDVATLSCFLLVRKS